MEPYAGAVPATKIVQTTSWTVEKQIDRSVNHVGYTAKRDAGHAEHILWSAFDEDS